MRVKLLNPIYLLVIVFFFNASGAIAQCESSMTAASNKALEQIEVSVKSKSSVEIKLYKFERGEYKLIDTQRKKGDVQVSFSVKDLKSIYKVYVTFLDLDGLCRHRQKGGITF